MIRLKKKVRQRYGKTRLHLKDTEKSLKGLKTESDVVRLTFWKITLFVIGKRDWKEAQLGPGKPLRKLLHISS